MRFTDSFFAIAGQFLDQAADRYRFFPPELQDLTAANTAAFGAVLSPRCDNFGNFALIAPDMNSDPASHAPLQFPILIGAMNDTRGKTSICGICGICGIGVDRDGSDASAFAKWKEFPDRLSD